MSSQIGFALNIELISIELTDIRLLDNKATIPSGLASLYSFKSHIKMGGTSLVHRNRQNAFVLDCSNLQVQGTMEFSDNIGENGAALSMFGSSFLFVSNSTNLLFAGNKVSFITFRKG